MKKPINREAPIFIDIDDTLLMFHEYNYEDCVEVTDIAGEKHMRKVHTRHVDLLKSYASRGYQIILWSGNGKFWAEQCMNVLNLNDYVDLCLAKPIKYIDDLPCETWMGSRVYIPFIDTEEEKYVKTHVLDPKG